MDRGLSRLAVVARPRVLLALVVVLGILAASASGGTLAYFTSTAASTANTFTAGTVAINIADADDSAGTAVTASITASNTSFRPGQTAAGYITTSNAGTLPFDYGIKYTLTNGGTPLVTSDATDPTLAVWTASATGNCTSGNLTGSKTGLTNVYTTTALSSTADTVIFDSGGGTKRSLAASGSEILCLDVNWPNGAAGAENAKQGASATIVFNYDARQQ